MTALDRLMPKPRLVEIDRVELAAPADRVWERIRHHDLPQSLIVRTLFALRTLVSRVKNADATPAGVRLDRMVSSPNRPGFQILMDDPPREIAVGAIGEVWRLDIPFVHVAGAYEFATFAERGFVKVAWAIRTVALAGNRTRVELEVRVAATDETSWRSFRRYFRVIGPASRFIRRSLLRALAREFGNATVPRLDDTHTGTWSPAA
ncbi:MAG TPA: hypothetical protein VHI98_23130, partial [Vicinamibacterales bacterium]|jgi:hypothetical protein|nr:hypothetical protein [Vicinamibacterales bacterium]